MSFPELVGYFASGLVFLTFCMKTMIPLRIVAMASNVAFICYSALEMLYPVLILHLVLLPLNIWRTAQMIALSRRVREASRGDLSFDWLKPFMKTAQHKAGATLFRRGDRADRIFYLLSGAVRLPEIDVMLDPGTLFGEIALFSPDRRRTQSAVCVQPVEVLWISDLEVAQLCFQNPAIAYHLTRIVTGRLLANLAHGARPATA
jgi:CRP/FNR family cyclic AMP-dependent transcriptional regulator